MERNYVKGKVRDIIHDSGRGAPLAVGEYYNQRGYCKKKSYMGAVEGMFTGQFVFSGAKADIKVGNCLPLSAMPEGTWVCNIEERPGDRGKMCRASGSYAVIRTHLREAGLTRLKLPSGKSNKIVKSSCRAMVGIVAGGGRLDKPIASNPSDIRVIPMDVSDFDVVKKCGIEAWEAFGHVDILINNAGISQRSLAVDTDFDNVVIPIINVDLLGQIAVTQTILNKMVDRKTGQFINISSAAGKIGAPLRSAYCAAKWGLLGYFENIRTECTMFGIKVCNVC